MEMRSEMPESGSKQTSARSKAQRSGEKDLKRNTYLLLRAYYITHEQHEFLRWRAYDKGVSQSASIREAIDRMVEEEGPAPKTSAQKRSKTKKEADVEGDNT